MGEIYARAYCTIIAYDSPTADTGLHGLPMLSVGSKFCYNDRDRSQVWRTRSWTFQEEIFSLRKIKMRSTIITRSCGKVIAKGEE